MIDFERILLPTDFSEFSGAAVEYACTLSRRFDAELHVIHVVQDLVAMVPEPGLAFPPPGDYLQEMEDAAVKSLDRVPGADGEGLNVVRTVKHGPPFLEIIRYAKDNDIDLIVMGTHGRSGLAHALLGSEAERVVRKAPCAVMTVRPTDHVFEMP